MEYFKEYYILFYKTFNDLWKSDIDWKAYSVEILSSVIGGILFIYGNGVRAVMENISGFVLSVLAIPGALALSYSVYKLIMTPVEIYKSQSAKYEPFGWDKVEINVKPFNILGLVGWGIEVKNSKGISLENVSVWYVGKREGQDETRLKEKERLGYINFKAEKIQFESTVIDSKERAMFVVTGQETGVMPVPFFRTHKMRYPTVMNFPDFAVDIEIKAGTLTYTELPALSKRLNIFPDGKVSERHAT